jgi:hypothetical protein
MFTNLRFDETLTATYPVKKTSPDLTDDSSSFKIFDLLRCPVCPKESQTIMTSNDGNRTQICFRCKRVLMKDCKLVNENKDENKGENKDENKDENKGENKDENKDVNKDEKDEL